MQTRSDQVQAHRFNTRRIVSALLSGEPETTERPMRRFGMAVFGSTMLAAIVFAGVGIYGFLFPAGATVSDPSIVIERETGARYVFIGGHLHPVLNFASARLIIGNEAPAIKTVSSRSLRSLARGPAVGIANAPDPLPERGAMTRGTWSACSLRKASGSADFLTHLVVGGLKPGGTPLGDGSALLIQRRTNANVSRWLIWQGHRLLVPQTASAALGLAAAVPAELTNAVIAGVPPGPDLAVPDISRTGEDGPTINGRTGKIGQVYLAAGQHYVLLDSGLATVGAVMTDLLLATGTTTVQEIPAGAAAGARSSSTPSLDPPGFPATMPQVVFRDAEPAVICVAAAAASDQPVTVHTYTRTATFADGLTPAAAHLGPDGGNVADLVTIPGSRAALVRTLPAPGDPTINTTIYLVTDQGKRYALPRRDPAKVLESLGYGGIEPLPVPVFLLALLPVGPTLDPAAAANPIDEPAPSAQPGPIPTLPTGQ